MAENAVGANATRLVDPGFNIDMVNMREPTQHRASTGKRPQLSAAPAVALGAKPLEFRLMACPALLMTRPLEHDRSPGRRHMAQAARERAEFLLVDLVNLSARRQADQKENCRAGF